MKSLKYCILICLLFFSHLPAQAAEVTSYRGVVGWFDNGRGFGFITPSSGITGNVFVHFSAILTVKKDDPKVLMEGQPVLFQFKVVEGQKRAIWVKVISP